jgi:hypothetical protein
MRRTATQMSEVSHPHLPPTAKHASTPLVLGVA